MTSTPYSKGFVRSSVPEHQIYIHISYSKSQYHTHYLKGLQGGLNELFHVQHVEQHSVGVGHVCSE